MIKIIYQDNSISSLDPIEAINEIYHKHASIYKDNKFDEHKKTISMITEIVPMYDIYTKNLYLIKEKHIIKRIVKYHYRLPTSELSNYCKRMITQLINSDKDMLYVDKL
jgi:hypothetical protein